MGRLLGKLEKKGFIGGKILKGSRYLAFVLILVCGVGLVIGGESKAQTDCDCPPEMVIKPGSASSADGEDIKQIQVLLQKLGLFRGRCDGRFNAETVRALKAYQRAKHIKETGFIDGPTWESIGNSIRSQLVTIKPPSENVRLIIDTRNLSLTVLVDGQPFKEFPVAIGKRETPTPIGDWNIIKKGKWSGGFGTRWLGLNVPYGIFGIHGTNKPWSIGRTESHGCIRMFNRDVEAVYSWVRVGTPVHIIGDPFVGRRHLMRGERGSDVLYLQKRLKQLGYFKSQPDGVFGYDTEKAILLFQTKMKMTKTGQVGSREYSRLRLNTVE